mmetsp:Transcript_10344/g.10366  ORF Transcript_10344/g.10366 Transcript_10344/m.10366 type:complete len:157 (-) Transcript_10344:1209-1679(-)
MEPEDEESTITKEEGVKTWLLLDRIFKFVQTEETPLNPVLAGYFSKLVSLLINRKQKQLVPYVFAPESQIIDQLLFHVYQKSISELLNKFLCIMDSEFEGEVQVQIQTKQREIVQKLINKLSPENSMEDNLNGCSILQDMLESKEFYKLVSTPENI